MERESTLGRVLWIGLLVVLGGYVISDFASSPFLAPSGSAAIRPTQVTLWIPAGERDGESGTIVEGAAVALELQGHTTSVKSLDGGSSQAVADFLSRPPHNGTDLLVVTSSTLAQLARDRRDRLVPGAAEQAALAGALLHRATPLNLLASDRLAIAVAPDSPIQDSEQLISSMRENPLGQLVAIPDDTWSRVELAALVDRAGVDGNIRFSVFQSTAEVSRAVDLGAAYTSLGTRGALREGVQSGHLRELDWPFDGGRAPRFWVALVAAPGLPPTRIAELRSWLHHLRRDAGWRAQLQQAGRDIGDTGGARLRKLLEHDLVDANRLELLSQRVERR
ncbi:MAG TPA: hypothetical protein VFI03_03225 [Solirubrobacterales bacterium]|nr:hypothetical protein [Solirubrobacterales bacterium]